MKSEKMLIFMLLTPCTGVGAMDRNIVVTTEQFKQADNQHSEEEQAVDIYAIVESTRQALEGIYKSDDPDKNTPSWLAHIQKYDGVLIERVAKVESDKSIIKKKSRADLYNERFHELNNLLEKQKELVGRIEKLRERIKTTKAIKVPGSNIPIWLERLKNSEEPLAQALQNIAHKENENLQAKLTECKNEFLLKIKNECSTLEQELLETKLISIESTSFIKDETSTISKKNDGAPVSDIKEKEGIEKKKKSDRCLIS